MRAQNILLVTWTKLRMIARLSSLHGPRSCSTAYHNYLGPPDELAKEGWAVLDPGTRCVVSDRLKALRTRLQRDVRD